MLQVPGHHNWPKNIYMADACGLYLANVEYCKEEFDMYKIKYNLCPTDNNIVIPVEEENEVNEAKI